MEVPWAREGSSFTVLFETMALALCQELPVRQAAALLRCSDKRLWRRIEHYVSAARALDDCDLSPQMWSLPPPHATSAIAVEMAIKAESSVLYMESFQRM